MGRIFQVFLLTSTTIAFSQEMTKKATIEYIEEKLQQYGSSRTERYKKLEDLRLLADYGSGFRATEFNTFGVDLDNECRVELRYWGSVVSNEEIIQKWDQMNIFDLSFVKEVTELTNYYTTSKETNNINFHSQIAQFSVLFDDERVKELIRETSKNGENDSGDRVEFSSAVVFYINNFDEGEKIRKALKHLIQLCKSNKDLFDN